MRAALFVMSCGVSLIACRNPFGTHTGQLAAEWMEWQEATQVGKPVSVLIAGGMTCGAEYERRYEISNSAIIFTPYEVVPDKVPCMPFVPVMFVDRIELPHLPVDTYQLRSGNRVFGELVITAAPPAASRLMGAGRVSVVRDPDSCVRLRPVMNIVIRPMPLENPPDTTSNWMGFVTGTITEGAAPVCEGPRVFHLLTRN